MLEDAGLLDALVVAPSQAAAADALLATEGLSDCRLDSEALIKALTGRSQVDDANQAITGAGASSGAGSSMPPLRSMLYSDPWLGRQFFNALMSASLSRRQSLRPRLPVTHRQRLPGREPQLSVEEASVSNIYSIVPPPRSRNRFQA